MVLVFPTAGKVSADLVLSNGSLPGGVVALSVECRTCDQEVEGSSLGRARGVKTLGKFLTPTCPCHQAVQVGTGIRAVMPCSWGVKAGMVCVWVACKLCAPTVTHESYLSALRSYIVIKALDKYQLGLLYFSLRYGT